MRNKIYIPFPDDKSIGGPLTFMRNLKKELDKLGFKYQNKHKFASSIFFPISYNIFKLRLLKAFGAKIIQRLDGIYYPSKHPDTYIKNNKYVKYIYKNLADYIVFQSEYSKKQVFSMFGSISDDKYSIICNGADLGVFYPSRYKKLHKKIRFITTGNFRNEDMIIPVVNALDNLKNVDFELLILGPISIEQKKDILSRPYVINSQTTNPSEIAGKLRASDIFIYSHLNPPCPNSVIEAVSCGLPVVGFDSGALKELCYFNSDLFAGVNGDVFQEYKDFDYKRLLEKIELCLSDFDAYKKISVDHAKEYSMEQCAQEYIKVFNSINKNKFNILVFSKNMLQIISSKDFYRILHNKVRRLCQEYLS